MENIQKYLDLLNKDTKDIYWVEVRPYWVGVYRQYHDNTHVQELVYYDKTLENVIHWLRVRLMFAKVLSNGKQNEY